MIREIACQQVLLEDGSLFSIQWSVCPSPLATHCTPGMLLSRYLSHIRRYTAAIVRPHCSSSGIRFCLFGSRWSLLDFRPPVIGGQTVVLRICGGMLVQRERSEQGELCFSISEEPEGTRISLELSGYYPLLLGTPSPSLFRCLLYRFSQAALHRLVTVRFLTLLCRELSGSSSRIRVVGVTVREGKPI